jgi:protein-disulfide isomerase
VTENSQPTAPDSPLAPWTAPSDRQVAQPGSPAPTPPDYYQMPDAQAPYPQPPYPHPVQGQPLYPQPGFGQPGFGQPPYPQPGFGQPGFGQPQAARPAAALGGGLPAAALAVAILAVILCFVPSAGVAVVIAAIAAIGLSVLAVRRVGGKPLGVAGIAVGAVALVVGVIMTVSTLNDNDEGTDKGSTAAASTDGPATADEDGAISVGVDGVAGSVEGTPADAIPVDVYSDYMCPYCNLFSQTNAAGLASLREDGTIILRYHLVSILDEASRGTAYSTRAATAAALVADQAPEEFVAFDAALFANQPEENSTGLTDEKIADIARRVGVPDDVAALIESGEYWTGPDSFRTWVTSATATARTRFERFGTPMIVIDGEQLGNQYDWMVEGEVERAIADAHG